MVRRVMDRTCAVCGHNLGPYGRICDKCGSIQRPAVGSGALLPPDKYKPCERCGQPMPEESSETLCDRCIESEKPLPVIVIEDSGKYGKAKKTAVISGGFSLGTLIASSVTLAFSSGLMMGLMIALLALSGVVLGMSAAIAMVAAKRMPGRIEYYAPIDQGTAPSTSPEA